MLLAVLSALSVSCYAGKSKTQTRFGEASNSCKGSSICYMTTTTTSSVDYIATDWNLSSDETTLTMSISDDNVQRLPDEVYDSFMQGYFDMNESYTMPADVVTALQGMSDITLRKGRYSVVHAGGAYTVTFHP